MSTWDDFFRQTDYDDARNQAGDLDYDDTDDYDDYYDYDPYDLEAQYEQYLDYLEGLKYPEHAE